jgi:thioredoxin reductase
MSNEYLGFNEYPKAIYHATEGMKVVADREEQDGYGDEWQETPIYPTDPGAEAAAPAPEVASEPEKAKRGRKSKTDSTVPETVGE